MIPLDWHANTSYGAEAEQHLAPLHLYLWADSADPVWLQMSDNCPGGWNPILPGQGWEMSADDHLIFPDLPPLPPAAMAMHLGERVFAYPAGWMSVLQLNGDFAVARFR